MKVLHRLIGWELGAPDSLVDALPQFLSAKAHRFRHLTNERRSVIFVKQHQKRVLAKKKIARRLAKTTVAVQPSGRVGSGKTDREHTWRAQHSNPGMG